MYSSVREDCRVGYALSLQMEVEVLGKQKSQWEVKHTLQVWSLKWHDESRKQTRLEGNLPPCPAPCTSNARHAKLLCKTRGQGEQDGVQLSAAPEQMLVPTRAPSAFPVLGQHRPANDGGPA